MFEKLKIKNSEKIASTLSRCLYQEHAESFPHDAVEEVEGGVSDHHEEVGEEEEFSAAVVQQSVVLTAKQRLIGILEKKKKTQTGQERFFFLALNSFDVLDSKCFTCLLLQTRMH